MKHRPHQGKLRRNFHIFRLYDSGEYSPQEIASQITASGWHCTPPIVSRVIKDRLWHEQFHAKHFRKDLQVNA
jgi:hypothetical protein